MVKEQLSLHIETRKLLIQRPNRITLKEVSEATGLNLRWLKSFKYVENPGVNPTQRLYEYLSGKTLTV